MSLDNRVSVVIPTLGGETLRTTVQQLNRGTLVPDEILICIPREDVNNVSSFGFDNVRIIETDFRGQVRQRAYGFAIVKSGLVLQLDDDILLDSTCLETLVQYIFLYPMSSVGPKFIDRATNKYHSYLNHVSDDFTLGERISYYILNGSEGFQPGKLSKAGEYMGLPESPDIWLNVGWLPGGCVLHRKENLVLENFYTLSGKAYWEDLFHSDLLRSKGVSMHRIGLATCTVDFSANKQISVSFFIKEFFQVLKILKLFTTKNGFGSSRMTIFYFFNTCGRIVRRLVRQYSN